MKTERCPVCRKRVPFADAWEDHRECLELRAKSKHDETDNDDYPEPRRTA